MTTAEQLEQWRGRDVVDADGTGIGKLDDVFYSSAGEPVLARVASGMFRRHRALVPLDGSSVGRDYLRVAFRHDQIEQAATEDVGEAIDEATATSIERAYGVVLQGAAQGFESSVQVEARRQEAEAAQLRAASLEADARHRSDDAQAAREHVASAAATATQAERDAAAAAAAAAEARRIADASSPGAQP